MTKYFHDSRMQPFLVEAINCQVPTTLQSKSRSQLVTNSNQNLFNTFDFTAHPIITVQVITELLAFNRSTPVPSAPEQVIYLTKKLNQFSTAKQSLLLGNGIRQHPASKHLFEECSLILAG